jgi:putative oxidoreductase
MRLVGGAAFLARAADTLRGASSMSAATASLAILAGVCLLAGFWTPIAGSVVTVIGLWFALTRTEDPMASVLLATIGATLALVGPGAWSVDARLFGWKRIDVRDRAR